MQKQHFQFLFSSIKHIIKKNERKTAFLQNRSLKGKDNEFSSWHCRQHRDAALAEQRAAALDLMLQSYG